MIVKAANEERRKGGNAMKIYVIEDNPIYNDHVCNLLEKDGFRTVAACHIDTAKKLLAKIEDDDIVLADRRLPDGDSIELLMWMRKNNMQHPFIIMTDYGDISSAVACMRLGSKDYIEKPMLKGKLLPLIRSIQREQERLHGIKSRYSHVKVRHTKKSRKWHVL